MVGIAFACLLYLFIPAVVLLLLLFEKKQRFIAHKLESPKVTVLVAARNEEHTILRCLRSLEELDYPKDCLQVLVGNDHSEDATAAVVAEYIKDKPHFQLIHVSGVLGQARAKANVLAQLVQHATGDYFFFTDADISVPKQWLKAMLAACDPQTGVVTGVTLIRGSRFFDKMQAIDWAFATLFIKALEVLRIPVAAMGNNMMIRKEAYYSTGGFENIPGTIIEDVAIFRKIVQQGWNFKQLYQAEVRAESYPVQDITEWLHQRKRWMKGAMKLPLYLKMLLILQTLAYPSLFILLFFYPVTALFLIFSRFALQWLILIKSLKKLDKTELLRYSLFYDFYSICLYLLLIVFYLLPLSTEWKGRRYFQESFN